MPTKSQNGAGNNALVINRKELDLCLSYVKNSKDWLSNSQIMVESVKSSLCDFPCDQCYEWASAALAKWMESPASVSSRPWWPELGDVFLNCSFGKLNVLHPCT